MDLYSVLEVKSSATGEEIRQAYRRLVRASHPDLYPGMGRSAKRRIVELNVAASILLDPPRRGEYDRLRALRRRVERRQSRQRRRAAAHTSGWYPWTTASYPGRAPDAWVREPRRRDPALERELRAVLDHLRMWPARVLYAFGRSSSDWPPKTHAMVTIASVGLAFLLIACARPRSLPMYQEDEPGARQPTVMTAPR